MDRPLPPPTIDYATPAAGRERADAFAVAAAWCGVFAMPLMCLAAAAFGSVAFAVAFLLALTALVCGVIGVARTGKRWRVSVTTVRARRPGNRWAWAGLLGAAAFVGLIVLLPPLGRARESAKRIKCGSNLRQIGQALELYAADAGGAFPPDFDTMVAVVDDYFYPGLFLCPSSGTTFQARSPSPGPLVYGQNCDYRYLGRGLGDAAPAGRLVAFDDPAHHDGEGANLLFADGGVRFVPAGELLDLLAEAASRPLPPVR